VITKGNYPFEAPKIKFEVEKGIRLFNLDELSFNEIVQTQWNVDLHIEAMVRQS